MNESPLLKTVVTYGLVLGCSLCLYTTLMWLTRLDTVYLATGQYLDVAVVALPVGVLAAAINQQRRRAYLPGWQRVGLALGVAIVAELVYRPYLALHHNWLNPEWFSFVLALEQAELLAAGRSAAAIAAELARLQAAHARQTGVFSGFWISAVVLPALVALLTLPFLRNRPKGVVEQ
ncbi:hypothetical protein [Hymenobacter elongatus]|uniref:DUF4199 domain-containing protein n=1 Tax=Hymenobacter elongatus TaxID=877208 RepID=A0A4Z0PPY1_9BACT|nr:hypothetical protein [Hymenobacter elongatus]TGE18960.1 hypothetical protein E5J99_04245 [Hymenobacter elongatus]